MSERRLEQNDPKPNKGCKGSCKTCACSSGLGSVGAPSQVEPHDELLRFSANADELAQRIRDGQGTDLNHLIGDAVRSRAA